MQDLEDCAEEEEEEPLPGKVDQVQTLEDETGGVPPGAPGAAPVKDTPSPPPRLQAATPSLPGPQAAITAATGAHRESGAPSPLAWPEATIPSTSSESEPLRRLELCTDSKRPKRNRTIYVPHWYKGRDR